jgi:hypothetical protein
MSRVNLKPTYLLGLTVLLLGIRIYFAYCRARVPFEIDYEEGNVLNAGLSVLRGQTPYPLASHFPYVINPYGPLGYLATALGLRMFGISLFGPRLLVLASGFAIAILISVTVRRCGGVNYVAWLFGSLYLCSPLVWSWYPLLRVDFWAVALSVLGVYVFLAGGQFRTASALIFACAILTKHTALAAPAACILDLSLQRRHKELGTFILIFFVVLGACFLSLGSNFQFAIFQTHPDPYSIMRALKLYLAAIEGALLPLCILALATFSGFRYARVSRVIWIYAATTSVMALTSGKLGSETNHFLEWTAAICILSGLALSWLLKETHLLARPLLAGILVLTGLFSVLPQNLIALDNQGRCEKAYNFIASYPGNKVLSEDVAALVLGHKQVLVSNPFVITQLGNRLNWSEGSLDDLVSQHKFDLIVLGGEVQDFLPSSGRWSSNFIHRVGESYQLDRTFFCSPNFGAVYRPRPTLALQHANNTTKATP